MPATDVISNMFSTIYNNEIRNKKECLVIPASSLASEVLRTMQRFKFIGEFELIDDGRGGKLRVQLLGRINKCGPIRPRFSARKNEFLRLERQYLPGVDKGILIVSTPQGVMSSGEALQKTVGGQLLGYVY